MLNRRFQLGNLLFRQFIKFNLDAFGFAFRDFRRELADYADRIA